MTTSVTVGASTDFLLSEARGVRENSYSPYSGCKVGAAIRTRSGNIYVGCNVENSSIGATVCAERGAIQSAIAKEGKVEIEELAVVSDASPLGCRADFAARSFRNLAVTFR